MPKKDVAQGRPTKATVDGALSLAAREVDRERARLAEDRATFAKERQAFEAERKALQAAAATAWDLEPVRQAIEGDYRADAKAVALAVVGEPGRKEVSLADLVLGIFARLRAQAATAEAALGESQKPKAEPEAIDQAIEAAYAALTERGKITVAPVFAEREKERIRRILFAALPVLDRVPRPLKALDGSAWSYDYATDEATIDGRAFVPKERLARLANLADGSTVKGGR